MAEAIASPADENKRILGIDVLRGAAILGILPMNIQLFAAIDGAFINPYAGQFTTGLDVLIWTFLQIFVGHKDLSVFGMLFGAGIILASERTTTRGGSPAGRHYRRMLAILIVGLIHSYGVWSGDILVTYAVTGAWVFVLRKAPAKSLVITGALLFAVPMMLLLAVQLLLPILRDTTVQPLYDMYQPTQAMIAAHNETWRSNWLTQFPARAENSFAIQTGLYALALGWVAGGLMTMGMGLQKWGLFSGKLSPKVYIRMAWIGLPLGWLLIILGIVRCVWLNWEPRYCMVAGRIPVECGGLIVAFGWTGLLMTASRRQWVPGLLKAIAAIGQTALSQYLLQSIVCSLIFYGHGLGLVGKVDRLGQLGLAVLIGAVQLWFASWLLARYGTGPMEWMIGRFSRTGR